MATTCKLLGNTGVAPCNFDWKNIQRIILVPEVDSTGVRNKFANVAALTESALVLKINATEKLDRFYPLPLFRNVEQTVAESTMQEFNDGSQSYVKAGVKNFGGIIPFTNPILLGELRKWNGQPFGVYLIDQNSNFAYMTDKATKTEVLPFKVDGGSFVVDEIPATDSEVYAVRIMFNYARPRNEELTRVLPADSLDFDGNDTITIYGLTDVDAAYTNEALTGFSVQLTSSYGLPVTGLTLTDFTELYNITNDSAIVITSVTESLVTEGLYDVVMPVQTSLDELRLTIEKDAYDFYNVKINTISIP